MKIARSTLRSRWLPGLVAALLLAAGCGGGVGTGGTGGYAQGPINGFGSVIVNDVHYDDGSAQVLDGDGVVRSRDDLKLGMMVDIDSSAISNGSSGPSASASRIRYASEMLGPVATVDVANGRLVVLGQQVQVSATTVFDGTLAGGIAALVPDQLVEVYAAYDPATGAYKATRIEAHGSATSYRLRGVIAQIDPAGRSLRIGSADFAYAGAGGVPSALGVGAFVRLQLQPAASGSNRWTVLSFSSGPAAPGDGLQAKVKGLISTFFNASSFAVNGQAVDASNASFPGGSAGLTLGVRVEVEGRMQGGVLRATQVTVQSDADEQAHGFDLRGNIGLLDTAGKTFVLRGVVVSYAGNVEFRNGTAAQLVNGAKLEVKGMLAAGGNVLQATRIEFDN